MSEKASNIFRLALADCIVEKLWVLGLISDTEKGAIDNKNKASFLSN